MSVVEEEIVQQIKLKNEEAISFILSNYGGLLNSIVRRYLSGSQQDIEECIADVITSVWFHIHSFDSGKNEFKQWIAAIAKYKAIDLARKSVKEQQLVNNLEENERVTKQQTTTENNLEIGELLGELSEVERVIFEKYYVEGVPSREIADQYHAKESWVHNKLSRGRKKLKNILHKSEVF